MASVGNGHLGFAKRAWAQLGSGTGARRFAAARRALVGNPVALPGARRGRPRPAAPRRAPPAGSRARRRRRAVLGNLRIPARYLPLGESTTCALSERAA